MSPTMRQKQALFNRTHGPRAANDSRTGVRARIAHGSEKLDSAIRRERRQFHGVRVLALFAIVSCDRPSGSGSGALVAGGAVTLTATASTATASAAIAEDSGSNAPKTSEPPATPAFVTPEASERVLGKVFRIEKWDEYAAPFERDRGDKMPEPECPTELLPGDDGGPP